MCAMRLPSFRDPMMICVALLLSATACSRQESAPPAADEGRVTDSARTPVSDLPSGPRLFVTDEVGGAVIVIDVNSARAIATIPVGKRPRGLVLSPDKSTIYVALSGTPIGGPNVDEDTLPPADKKA